VNAVLRILAWTLALALIALPVVAVVNGWIGAERWPLRTLRINADLQRVDVARLRATVLPYAEAGFFAVKLGDAQRAVARLPWVEHAEVRKRWPDVVEVRVLEHRPFARWGEDRLLSEQGRLFASAGIEVPAELPLLHGPDARVNDVVQLYNESRELFAPTGFDVRALRLDSRGSWAMTLSNGTDVIVGSREARLRLARFARLMPQLLAQKQSPLARADLRYTNGFALSWPAPGAGDGAGSDAGDARQARARAGAAHPFALPGAPGAAGHVPQGHI
jgi:cell division protein FtsQ